MSEDSPQQEEQAVDPLENAQGQLNGAEKAAEDMRAFLLDVAAQLRRAFDDTLVSFSIAPKQGFEKWVREWHGAVAKTMYLLRSRTGHNVVGSSSVGDWVSAEKLLGFLVAENFLPTLDDSDPRAQRRACRFEQLPPDLAQTIIKYLGALTVHDFVSIKAYLISISAPENRDSETLNYFAALGWIDRQMLSWISSQCPYPNECSLLKHAQATAAVSFTKRVLIADHLIGLASKYDGWVRTGRQERNPLDELRYGSMTMLDLALTCRCTHEAIVGSRREPLTHGN